MSAKFEVFVKILFFCFLVFSLLSTSLRLSAQVEQPVKVRIQLQNHESIHGRLLLKEIPVILSVYINDNDSMAVPTKIIRQITIEKGTEENPRGMVYFNNTTIGILTGRTNSQSSYRSMITAEMVNGIIINTYFWTGLGVAFDQFPEVSTLPLFLTIRGDMMKQPFTPFYFFDIGTGPSWNAQDPFSTEQETDAGLMYHFGSGIKIYGDSRINVMLAIGFKSQQIKFTRNLWDDQEEVIDRNYKNFSFRIGIGF